MRNQTRKHVLLFAIFIWFMILLYLSLMLFNEYNITSFPKKFNFHASRHPKFIPRYHSHITKKWILSKSIDELKDYHHETARSNERNLLYPKKVTTSSSKMWFMSGGNVRPEELKINVEDKLWPEQSKGDRIIEQMVYLPQNYSYAWSADLPLSLQSFYDSNRNKLKRIILLGQFDNAGNRSGRSIFWKSKCPVNTCTIINPNLEIPKRKVVDAVVVKERMLYNGHLLSLVPRQPHQVWILYMLESPVHSPNLSNYNNVFNWTATYRRDSDIVTPYGKFLPYHEMLAYSKAPEYKNYAENKTKKVVWFVSHCSTNNGRFEYAEWLSHYIEVDVFGSCGMKSCPREKHSECLEMLERDYKFYLAFENSNCMDYITEKFFENGLKRNILPIVMGPPREHYERLAPPHSFIHVDDFVSPKELADYLHILDGNATLYNEYFTWKGTGEFIDTHFWCRLCAMLHAPSKHRTYEDIQGWWAGPGICRS